MKVNMKINKFILVIFYISLTAQAEVNDLTKYQPGAVGNGHTGGNKLAPAQFDRQSITKLNNDDFPIKSAYKALGLMAEDHASQTRSVRDAALFKNLSPSIVLIVNNDSLGSGTLINKNGDILTNQHVVGVSREVGVIFKPEKLNQKISKADIRRAVVLKIDQTSDLALIRMVDNSSTRAPVKLGDSSDISVGADVHAIGHPQGESWTYTKGVVSQYRNAYAWDDGKFKHQADVIQTQTPINPGNSGGPLLNDNGLLIGVNTFKATESEGINFAVSVDEVKKFISRGGDRLAVASSNNNSKNTTGSGKSCELKELFRGQSADKKGDLISYDSSCSGKSDLEVIIPYDKTQPVYAQVDKNGDGRADTMYFSFNRDMKWDMSFWDVNYDGVWDLVGYHTNGESTPSRYEDYKEFNAKINQQASK